MNDDLEEIDDDCYGNIGEAVADVRKLQAKVKCLKRELKLLSLGILAIENAFYEFDHEAISPQERLAIIGEVFDHVHGCLGNRARAALEGV